jgi:hypothetical protein
MSAARSLAREVGASNSTKILFVLGLASFGAGLVTGGVPYAIGLGVISLYFTYDDMRQSWSCTCGDSCECTKINMDILGSGHPESYMGPDHEYWKSHLQKWYDSQSSIPRPVYDPLVLDLNRDEKLELQNATFFDLNANGFHEFTRWISETDAFLVLDKNADAVVANNASFQV